MCRGGLSEINAWLMFLFSFILQKWKSKNCHVFSMWCKIAKEHEKKNALTFVMNCYKSNCYINYTFNFKQFSQKTIQEIIL